MLLHGLDDFVNLALLSLEFEEVAQDAVFAQVVSSQLVVFTVARVHEKGCPHFDKVLINDSEQL